MGKLLGTFFQDFYSALAQTQIKACNLFVMLQFAYSLQRKDGFQQLSLSNSFSQEQFGINLQANSMKATFAEFSPLFMVLGSWERVLHFVVGPVPARLFQ